MIDRSTNIQAALRSRQRGFLLNPFRFGGGGGGGGDPHFANVSLLMHMDGSDGGTTFVDSGPLGLTPITVTSATTRPGSAVYGSGGMLLTGASANGVTFTHATAFQFAESEPFTIEMRVRLERPVAGSDYDWLLHMSSSGGNFNTGLYMRWSDAGFSQALQCAISDTLRVSGFSRSSAYNNYASIAYCRKSDGMTTLFVDGVGVSTMSNGQMLGATHVRVGCALDNTYPIQASVDELRITKGVCRYTANYTPSAEAFPNS